MLKQLFSNQNKEKNITLVNEFLSPRNEDRQFVNLTCFFFSFAPTFSPYSYVSN